MTGRECGVCSLVECACHLSCRDTLEQEVTFTNKPTVSSGTLEVCGVKIYVSSTDTAEQIADKLRAAGLPDELLPSEKDAGSVKP